jgi:chemotaxis regulatin CheY-phosphate phosphatase CheZ
MRKLDGRRFFDRAVKVKDQTGLMDKVMAALPAQEQLKDAIVRLTVEYPRELDQFLDEGQIRAYCEPALEFHLVRRPQEEARLRLPADQSLASLSAVEMLQLYWQSVHAKPQETDELKSLAEAIMQSVDSGNAPEEGNLLN